MKKTGCWEWTASRTVNGYGKLGTGGKHGGWTSAHRVAWIVWVGKIPKDLAVLHKCDNPPCINPAHLFLGTQKDNMTDMYGKGRGPVIDHRGAKNPRFGARLSKDTRRAISQSLCKIKYRIVSPSGASINFTNLKAFAKANDLNVGHLSMLRRGLCKTAKGFTGLRYIA